MSRVIEKTQKLVLKKTSEIVYEYA